jgi:guanosine-3',5'-bis(diphosphate) 3'-pyrophosphohydrolase
MLTVSLENEVQIVQTNLEHLYRNHPIVIGDFNRLVAGWHKEWGKLDVPFLLAVIDFAALKHLGQMRTHADWIPYFIHPLRVALILWEEGGIKDTDLLASALLHDTLEDTQTTEEEIIFLCGNRILSLVKELTEKPGGSCCEDALTMSPEAKIIKLADRTHNMRDLLDHPPQVWKSDKVEIFIEKSKKLLEALKGEHPELERAYRQALDRLEKTNQS